MKSAGKARNNGLYRHIRTSKEIIRNLLNDFIKKFTKFYDNVQKYTIYQK
jgi:predicted transcriptional regulator